MPLTKLSNDQGFLKAGFLGYQKSGKSYTATKLAIGVRSFFKLPGPIAFYDTEAGSGYLAEMVRKETGMDLLGVRARSFESLMQFAKDCLAEKVSVAIVDSVTHPWRELCDSYLAQLNERRKEKRLYPLQKLEFQHWASIKAMWEPWSEFFLNSPLHMIVCGRAGAIWEFEKNEESGRKELVKAGTKMKVEGEFGFEPSLLVEMERDQQPDGQGGFKLIHTATVLGDRFSILDGQVSVNPTFEFFKPHVAMLRAGAHSVVDTTNKTTTGADIEGNTGWERERRERTILCEEIMGDIVSKYPGQSADEKKAKADLISQIFGTRSWTKVENMQADVLRDGLIRLRSHLGIATPGPVSSNETEDDLPFEKLPQTGQANLTGLNTPPAAQTPQGAPIPPQGGGELPPLARIRGFIGENPDKVTEREVIATLIALGSLEPGVDNLDQVALLRPDLLKTVADSWGTYAKSCLQFRKELGGVKPF